MSDTKADNFLIALSVLLSAAYCLREAKQTTGNTFVDTVIPLIGGMGAGLMMSHTFGSPDDNPRPYEFLKEHQSELASIADKLLEVGRQN
jgi:hypothetical protein